MARTRRRKKKRNEAKAEAMRRYTQDAMNQSLSSCFNFPVGVFTPKQEKYTLDILPYRVTVKNHPRGISPGDTWFECTYRQHSGVGADNDRYICPQTVGKRCPICEYRAKLISKGVRDKAMLGDLRAKERQLFNVRVKFPESGPVQIFDISTFLFGQLLAEEIDDAEDEEIRWFYELDGGHSLRLRFKEDSFEGRSFWKIRNIAFKARPDLPESLLDDTVDLDSCLVILDFDELNSKFFELGAARFEDFDTDDEDYEDEDDNEPEDDDEEEEKPRRRTRRSRVREEEPEDEDDDEPEDEDEYEDEEGDDEEYEDEDADDEDGDSDSEDDDEDADDDDADDDEEEEEEPEPPKRSRRKPAPKKSAPKKSRKSKSENECPAGGTFGQDVNKFEDCVDCEKWDDCDAEYAKIVKPKAKKGGRRKN